VPDMVAGRYLRPDPEGYRVNLGEGDEGGPSPPEGRGDKQSTFSMEGGNMEKEEEGRRSWV
jgi:hypothetical protein